MINLFSGQRAYIERLIYPHPYEATPPIESPVARAIIRDLLNDMREMEQENYRLKKKPYEDQIEILRRLLDQEAILKFPGDFGRQVLVKDYILELEGMMSRLPR